MNLSSVVAFVVLSLSASCLPQQAFAWGTQGHQVIAEVAGARLTAKARVEVDRLLALEPGATLASISTWADEHRNPASAAWHFINFPRDSCSYDPQRDCPGGQCVVATIVKQLEILGSGAPDEKRLLALKNVVHLVADVHQPLHSGYADDRGGNTYQLQAFMKGTNLHALWDVGLIRNLNQDTATVVTRLLSLRVQVSDVTAANAAEESCRIVGTPGFYPDRKIDAAYVQRFTPVMENQLAIAGARLAAVLNRIFR